MNPNRLKYLDAMGIQVYVPRLRTDTTPVEVMASDQVDTSEVSLSKSESLEISLDRMDWLQLRERVSGCTQCSLAESRTQTVFGTGNENADWLFIGEAPGQDEDRQGEPFVGRAGQLLNNMLLALGLSREHVFIANILKCRPPKNRDPKPEESKSCKPYLRRQIELLQPRIIVALGRIAAQNLLETETPIGKLRGRAHRYADTNIPLVVTYHPAYLLRSPKEKSKSWQDLVMAKQMIND